MNRYLIFPYDSKIDEMLNYATSKIDGVIEDLLTVEGWGESEKTLEISEKKYNVKAHINEISSSCNSLWIVETNQSVDFFSIIVPVLIHAREKQWSVYYGKSYSKDEEIVIRKIIEERRLFVQGYREDLEDLEEKIYDIRIPVVWVANMFSHIPYTNFPLIMHNAFQNLGYSVGHISHRKELSIIKDVNVMPDMSLLSSHEIVKKLNHFIKRIEKEKKYDLLMIEVPGNLLEISKKICGDYGASAYLMSKAALPDVVICNIPYMDNILKNKENLISIINATMNIQVDFLNMVSVYFDLIESEQMQRFEYVTLSDTFIDNKIAEYDRVYNINSLERAKGLVNLIIQQLRGYSD